MQGDAKMNNNGQVKKWWVFKPVHNADAIFFIAFVVWAMDINQLDVSTHKSNSWLRQNMRAAICLRHPVLTTSF